MSDRIFKVVIDRREDDFFAGRTEFDSPEVDQEVLIPVEYDLSPGNFYDIMIIQAAEFDLFGKPVPPSASRNAPCLPPAGSGYVRRRRRGPNPQVFRS